MESQPIYDISGQARRLKKKELNAFKRLLANESQDQDLHKIYGTDSSTQERRVYVKELRDIITDLEKSLNKKL